ncbi:quinoprotein dehydrogenase-associated putative ABC transporter substrate-binding protein [Ramlibacter sp. G-1-2-2]|uniref:Quinoprotein dehydrogenase-associated putative ABC transporter substrate-binding protein n=1 Tax=Ramlibacter agri TaxID=2728837 RepID=A0A848H3N1_9BURK|nr:substrate-binding domain-containing protein [Ramlibacter agri]NML45576.1 quinoprotein dehydrogenase-associated putative ABC transporter substrate-binding protein [Ramlibacter agri]
MTKAAWAMLVPAVLVCAGGAARAQPAPDEARTAFRVCQDPNNLPFSNVQGEGFENKIAELFAHDLGLPLDYFSFPNRLAFIRNTLRYKLPDQPYRCDVVLGVPADFDQVSATKPYYRSTYVLVFPKGRGLDALRGSDDLLALAPDKLRALRIGVGDRSPGSLWLARHELLESGVPYPVMSPDPDAYPGQIIERDLAQGKIDAAIVWGPIAGYFAKRVRSPELVLVPMKSEPGLPFDYAIAMGVRYGEPAWKQQIEGLLVKHREAILAILREYNVPLVAPPAATASQ